MVIRSEKSHKEDNYIKYVNKYTNNGIHYKINEIRMENTSKNSSTTK